MAKPNVRRVGKYKGLSVYSKPVYFNWGKTGEMEHMSARFVPPLEAPAVNRIVLVVFEGIEFPMLVQSANIEVWTKQEDAGLFITGQRVRLGG